MTHDIYLGASQYCPDHGRSRWFEHISVAFCEIRGCGMRFGFYNNRWTRWDAIPKHEINMQGGFKDSWIEGFGLWMDITLETFMDSI